MTLALNALQKGIYDRLVAQLTSPVVPVYDHVPQNSTPPYVVIGEDTTLPWDTKTQDGQEFTCTVHVWDYLRAGRKSSKTLMQSVYAALHLQEANVTVTGYSLVLLRCEFSHSIQEQGEVAGADQYYHGIMRFRALVQDA